MIINLSNIVKASSYSANKGQIELELESPFPELKQKTKKGEYVIFIVAFCKILIVVDGIVEEYQEIPLAKEIDEQEVYVRAKIKGRSVAISF